MNKQDIIEKEKGRFNDVRLDTDEKVGGDGKVSATNEKVDYNNEIDDCVQILRDVTQDTNCLKSDEQLLFMRCVALA
eukprot:scaffold572_cov229-Amphora_coffeaeformis.AAC.12